MASKKTTHDYKLIKVDGYNANKNYIYGHTFPDGKKVTVGIDSKTKTDIVGYLSDESDSRHAPKDSILSLDSVTEHSDTYYTAKWARSISKNPQTEDVIVAPTSISAVIPLPNEKTTVLSRIVDPVPLSVGNFEELKRAALSVIKEHPSGLAIKGMRGFLIRVGVANTNNVNSGTFKGDFKRSAEQVINDYFNNTNGKVDPRISALLNAAGQVKSIEGGFIEVVGFTDLPVFNYGNSKNDHDLANVANFKIDKGDKKVPTFSFAAITIDRQGNGKVTKVTPLPGGKSISSQHALVGTHDPKNQITLPFTLPKVLVSAPETIGVQEDKIIYPVTIKNYIHESNKQYDSIVVSVREGAPKEIYERVLNAVSTPPRKGNDGYYFNKNERKKVESALSDVAGTPALYTFTGSINSVPHTFIGGRTNDPAFKERLDKATVTSDLRKIDGGFYAVPQSSEIQVLSSLSSLLKEPATSTLAKAYIASIPKIAEKVKPNAVKRTTYIEWLDNVYFRSAERLASEIESEISKTAEEAGIDWNLTKGNINWPSLNGPDVNIGTTANVKPLNSNDNGSCYVSVSFPSWKTRQGNEQYGISVTFTNLNKDRDARWNVVSHGYTVDKYQEEIWGKNPVERKTATPEEIAAEKEKAEAKARVILAEKVAKADAQKANAFNVFTALPMFTGQHKQMEIKNIPNATKLLNAKLFTYKKDPSNSAFAYAAYDIHERFVGYQYVLENKVLADVKKNKWTNKFFNFGMTKDDVRTGLPLGTHHTIGEIDANNPSEIYYAEGWANAVTNFELTGKPSVICFDKDNMKKVIGLMTKKYPNHKHIHVADNDLYKSTNGNVGVLAALDNAYNFGAQVVIPSVNEIAGYIEHKHTDTSDMFVNGLSQRLIEQLNNPVDLSDPISNKVLRIAYEKDANVEKAVADLVKSSESEELGFEDIKMLVEQGLDMRTKAYKVLDNDYVSPFTIPLKEDAIARLVKTHEGAINLEKIDYAVVKDNKSTPEKSAIEGSPDPKQSTPVVEIPTWPVKVSAIPHPQKPSGHVTEIRYTDPSQKEYISQKLEHLGAVYIADVNNNRFFAEHKYYNLINAALCNVTGASRFYIGRSPTDKNIAVIRGDFTNDTNNQIIAPIAKSLGLEYSEKAIGFIVENPNKLVFIKEALKEHFEKINPDVEYAHTLELTPEQSEIQSSLVKVAHSLGLESKDIAKQHIKLSQHNESLANLYSPVVAGMYVHAENKVKASQTDVALEPAERIYINIKTLHTMLSTLDVTNPTLEAAYKEDVSSAIDLIEKQLGLSGPKTTPDLLEFDANTDEASVVIENIIETEEVASPQVAIEIEAQAVAEEELTLQEQIAVFQNDEVTPNIEVGLTEIETEEVEGPVTAHTDPVEVRLNNLIEFVRVYLDNEYEVDEVIDALREPGSPYYDTTDGYRFDMLNRDLKQLKALAISHVMGLSHDISTPARLVAEINNYNIQKRLSGLDVFIANILEHNPAMGTVQAAAYAKKGIYQGVSHPYMDEDGTYNMQLIKEDISSIEGLDDVTTFTGYFKLKQAENNSGTSIEFIANEDKELNQDVAISALKLFPARKITASTEKQINLPATKPLQADKVERVLETPVHIHASKVLIDNEKSDYDNLYRIAAQCAQEQMTYTEFYDAVFKDTGDYYDQNPFNKDGVLQKAEVVKALVPNNFKSPKAFYESAYKDVQGKSSNAVELTRVAGIVPEFVDANAGLAGQFSSLSVLTEGVQLPIEKALAVTQKSFKMWLKNEVSTVALHPIFAENLSSVSANELAEKYTDDAIKFLADAHCVSINAIDNKVDIASQIISQWKIQVELADVNQATFADLPFDTQRDYATKLGLPAILTDGEVASVVYTRLHEIKTTSKLRLSQYSYIKSALTAEKHLGLLPIFTYKQLNNLLSNEVEYAPTAVAHTKRIAEIKLFEQAEKAQVHLQQMGSVERVNADLEQVPAKLEIIGLEQSDYVSISKYKYAVIDGDHKHITMPPHISYYAVYGEDKVLTNEPLSLSDMKKQNIQPINREAIIESLGDAKDYYENLGFISFTTEQGLYGVIHKNKSRSTLRVINTKDNQSSTYPAKNFEDALDKALDFFPVSSIEFQDGFTQEFIDSISPDGDARMKSLETVYQTLINTVTDESTNAAMANEIALDILAKANQLDIEIGTSTDDSLLRAVAILDGVREAVFQSTYETLIDGVGGINHSYNEIIEHIEQLALEQDALPEVVSEDIEGLLEELNQSALRDLNIGLTLEPDVMSVKEFIAQDNYLPDSDIPLPGEAEILESLIAEMDGNDSSLENPVAENIEPITNAVQEEIQVNNEVLSVTNEAFVLSQALAGYDTNVSFIDNTATVEAGKIAVYRLGDDVRFGYVTEVNGENVVTRYSLQDESQEISTQTTSLNTEKDGKSVPIYAMSFEEYSNTIKDATSITHPRISKIMDRLSNVMSMPVKDIRLLSEFIGTDPVTNRTAIPSELGFYIDNYFRVQEIAKAPSELVTDDDKEFINEYFGDDNAEKNLVNLAADLSKKTKERISKFIYDDAVTEVGKLGVKSKVILHPNNTVNDVSINSVDEIYVVDAFDFKTDIVEPTPVHTIMSKLLNSNNSVQLAAKVLVTLEDRMLLEKLPESSIAWSACVTNGVWDKSELSKEDIEAQISVFVEPEDVIIASKGESIYFISDEGEIFNGLIEEVVKDSDTTAFVAVNKEGEIDYVTTPLNTIVFDAHSVDEHTQELVSEYLTSIESMPVSQLTAPYATDVDDIGNSISRFSSILANAKIKETLDKAQDELKEPQGYELGIDKGYYIIIPTQEGKAKKQYDEIGTFAEISDLNRAILVAKRNINGVNHDKNKSLRSEAANSPQGVLPSTSNSVSEDERVGKIHTGEASGVRSNGTAGDKPNEQGSEANDELQQQSDSTTDDQAGGRSNSSSSDISRNGVNYQPNITYQYSEEITEKLQNHKTPVETYELNMAAIRLAKELTSENRDATDSEKEVLAQYRGWGGLSQILDNNYMNHGPRRAELKEIVSADEYESIKRSTLSAFYTSPLIAKAVWNGIERLGVKGGMGLDPAFGVGNFASAIPDSLAESVTLQAKEIDPLTAEIAGHIHGKMVVNEGYEKTKLPNNHFDFVTGNIPFGNYKVYDKNYRDLSKHLIHDYFNLKSLELVKPGKIVAFITSSGTLDKESSEVRKKIAKQADLVGAIRLPTNAFEDNANTSVNTDIIFLQKRIPGTEPVNTDWIESEATPMGYNQYASNQGVVNFNKYFINNPEMVLGDTTLVSSKFGTTYKTELKGDLSSAINEAISKLPENIVFEYEADNQKTNTQAVPSTEDTENKRLGSYYLDGAGDIAIAKEVFKWDSILEQTVSSQVLEKADIKKNQIDAIKGLIEIREAAKSHLGLMLKSHDEVKFEQSKVILNEKYDSFVKKHGPVNKQSNKRMFNADPDSALVLGLEAWDKKAKVANKADIFSERTIYPKKIITKLDDAEDAVLVSLTENGFIDTEQVEGMTGKTWSNIVGELHGKLFLNPESNDWEHSSTYLAGHVKNKLKLAQQSAALDDIYKDNVEHLEKVIPAPIPYYEIRVKLGSSWIPENDIRDFVKFIVTGDQEPCDVLEREKHYKVTKVKGYWELNISSYKVSVNSGRTENEFGTSEWPADKLIYAVLNNKSITVHGTDSKGKRFILKEATTEANAKADLIKETFKQWLWQNPERTKRIEQKYNDTVNGFVEPAFDGSKVEIAGLSSMLNGKEFKPRPKQLNAIMRYLVDGRALFLHDVGVGKSFALLGSIIKGKEIGKHSKALLTVPNSVFPQMQSLALGHFPNAKILMVDAKKLDKNSREETIATVATNNWDIVIMPHSITQRLDVPEEFKADLIEQELSEVSAAIDALEDSNYSSSRAIKGYQTKLENAKAKAEARMADKSSYDTVNIAEMGIDALFVDEADEFVNLDKVTNMGHVAGVAIRESAKARSLYNLTQYLHHVNGNQGIVLATGTDIRNNIADQFTLLRYLAPDMLMDQDIDMFDDFIGTFGEIQTQFEIAPEGSGFIEKTRLSKFYNLPELAMIYRQVADIVNAEDAQITRPNIEIVNVHAEQSEHQSLYMDVLADRAKAVRSGSKVDNLLAISGDGNKAALDMRLIHPSLPDFKDSKVNECVKNVLAEYHENKELNPSQIIFSDTGVPNSDGRFDLYNDIKQKLIAGGIDEDKIVFARDFKTDAKKQDLQDRMNSGEIAVAIGSTENMGVGKNVQERLAAIHDLSIPWRVRDLEQRGGRIERFGNIFENAKRYQYTTDDSFDIFRWQKLKQKAIFAAQTKMSPRDAAREIDEEITLSYSEIMAAATGNPLVQESIELETQIDRLAMLERSFHRAKVDNEFNKKYAQGRIKDLTESLNTSQAAKASLDISKITILGKPLDDAGNAIGKINKTISAAKKGRTGQEMFEVGEMDGMPLFIKTGNNTKKVELVIDDGKSKVTLSKDHHVGSVINGLTGLSNQIDSDIRYYASQINFYEAKVESLNAVVNDKFDKADEIVQSKLRLTEIQKEMAEMAEAEGNTTKEDPLKKWFEVIDAVEGEYANELLKEINSKKALDQDHEPSMI